MQYYFDRLKQRVKALNEFLRDIYSDGKIISDGVISEEFVYSGSGYLAGCRGVNPPKNIYAHISGASYPMAARELCR